MEYKRLKRRFFIPERKIADIFCVSMKTVKRWERTGAPMHVVRFLQFIYERNLESINNEWKGFKIGFDDCLS